MSKRIAKFWLLHSLDTRMLAGSSWHFRRRFRQEARPKKYIGSDNWRSSHLVSSLHNSPDAVTTTFPFTLIALIRNTLLSFPTKSVQKQKHAKKKRREIAFSVFETFVRSFHAFLLCCRVLTPSSHPDRSHPMSRERLLQVRLRHADDLWCFCLDEPRYSISRHIAPWATCQSRQWEKKMFNWLRSTMECADYLRWWFWSIFNAFIMQGTGNGLFLHANALHGSQ